MLEAQVAHEKARADLLAKEHAELASQIQSLTQTITGQIASLDASRAQQTEVNASLQRGAQAVSESLKEMDGVCQTFKGVLIFMQNHMQNHMQMQTQESHPLHLQDATTSAPTSA